MMRFTVLFNDPYWIGLLEAEYDGCLYAATHIFGSEPGDQQVYEFVRRDLGLLQARMTVGLPVEMHKAHHVNPKRRQRELRHEVAQHGVGTRAQEAIRLQLEQGKRMRQQLTREQKNAHREHKRELARAKAKAKHRGR